MNLETITFIISIFGIGIAIVSFILAIQSNQKFNENFQGISDEFKAAHKKIEDLTESVQTKKIRKFPDNLQQIVDLILSAKKSVEIYSDLTCYGIYSNPELFDSYSRAIEIIKANSTHKSNSHSKHDDSLEKVRIYTYGKDLVQAVMSKFFNSENTSIEEIKISSYAKRLKDSAPTEYEEFLKIDSIETFNKHLTQKEIEFKKSLDFKNISYNAYRNEIIEFDIPFFMWIRDDMEAIIAFPQYVKTPNEYSIRTLDRDLIEIFRSFLNAKIDGKSQLLKIQ